MLHQLTCKLDTRSYHSQSCLHIHCITKNTKNNRTTTNHRIKMSLYLTLLFLLLVTEMAILFVLLMPLPHMVRKRIGYMYNNLKASSQMKTVLVVFSILVSSLFADSMKRGARPLPLDRNLVTPDMLATKAYHQRNIYISGFILYFGLCIPIVMGVIAKLVKYEDTLKIQSGVAERTAENDKTENLRVDKTLLAELKEKRASLLALQKQLDNKNAFIDKQLDKENGTKTASEKKNE